jgi:hypothetical protein
MSGMKPLKPAPGRRPVAGNDECDLRFRTDLMGVRASAAESVRAGDFLEVRIIQDGDLRSVVCCSRANEVVGALSAFPGLAQLIMCIEAGVRYSALVERSSARSCTVYVSRSR